MLFESHYYCLNAAFSIKLLSELNCEESSRKVRPWAKRVWREGERWDRPVLSALLSERPAVAAASVGITYETKQSVTTQDIIHKGPVCRQQAELENHILLVAKTRKLYKWTSWYLTFWSFVVKAWKYSHYFYRYVTLCTRSQVDQTGSCHKTLKMHLNNDKLCYQEDEFSRSHLFTVERLYQCLAFIYQPEPT